MKALITGANGFVGRYLTDELKKSGYEVCGMDIIENDNVHYVDLLDYFSIEQIIKKEKPDCLFHLAGQSSVALSWEKPQLTFDINVKGTLNLLEAIRKQQKECTILMIGSSDEYGRVRLEDCPIQETLKPNPCNPYAISKLTQEEVGLLYVRAYNMKIVMTRSFNHTGPEQKRGFVIPDFCYEISKMERTGTDFMKVGNLEARRDFSDVRDIVRAYRLLVETGEAGEIYNVGSGKAYSIRELLDVLLEMSKRKINVCVDPDKMRPIDLPLIESDIHKLSACTGYQPQYDIRQTLCDTLEYWRSKKENV